MGAFFQKKVTYFFNWQPKRLAKWAIVLAFECFGYLFRLDGLSSGYFYQGGMFYTLEIGKLTTNELLSFFSAECTFEPFKRRCNCLWIWIFVINSFVLYLNVINIQVTWCRSIYFPCKIYLATHIFLPISLILIASRIIISSRFNSTFCVIEVLTFS